MAEARQTERNWARANIYISEESQVQKKMTMILKKKKKKDSRKRNLELIREKERERNEDISSSLSLSLCKHMYKNLYLGWFFHLFYFLVLLLSFSPLSCHSSLTLFLSLSRHPFSHCTHRGRRLGEVCLVSLEEVRGGIWVVGFCMCTSLGLSLSLSLSLRNSRLSVFNPQEDFWKKKLSQDYIFP